jgi:hypothetical protein
MYLPVMRAAPPVANLRCCQPSKVPRHGCQQPKSMAQTVGRISGFFWQLLVITPDGPQLPQLRNIQVLQFACLFRNPGPATPSPFNCALDLLDIIERSWHLLHAMINKEWRRAGAKQSSWQLLPLLLPAPCAAAMRCRPAAITRRGQHKWPTN